MALKRSTSANEKKTKKAKLLTKEGTSLSQGAVDGDSRVLIVYVQSEYNEKEDQYLVLKANLTDNEKLLLELGNLEECFRISEWKGPHYDATVGQYLLDKYSGHKDDLLQSLKWLKGNPVKELAMKLETPEKSYEDESTNLEFLACRKLAETEGYTGVLLVDLLQGAEDEEFKDDDMVTYLKWLREAARGGPKYQESDGEDEREIKLNRYKHDPRCGWANEVLLKHPQLVKRILDIDGKEFLVDKELNIDDDYPY